VNIYLCGPLTNDYGGNNVKLFEYIETILKKDGHNIYNPFQLYSEYPNESSEFYKERCIKLILNANIDLLLVIDGWEKSGRCQKEISAGKISEINIMPFDLSKIPIEIIKPKQSFLKKILTFFKKSQL
jgi:hypothetical protein